MCYSPAREPSMPLFSSKWVKLLRSWPSADPSPITLPPAPTMGPSLCHMWVWLVSSGRDCVRSGPLPFSRLLPVLGKAPGIQQDPAECQTLWETSWPCLPVLAECCVLLLFLQHLDWPLMRRSFYDQFFSRPWAPQGLPFNWRPTLTDWPLGVCGLAQCLTQGLSQWKGKRAVSRQVRRDHEILDSGSQRWGWVQGLATKTQLEKSWKQNKTHIFPLSWDSVSL